MGLRQPLHRCAGNAELHRFAHEDHKKHEFANRRRSSNDAEPQETTLGEELRQRSRSVHDVSTSNQLFAVDTLSINIKDNLTYSYPAPTCRSTDLPTSVDFDELTGEPDLTVREDLVISQGQLIAVVGRRGEGKTTLLKL